MAPEGLGCCRPVRPEWTRGRGVKERLLVLSERPHCGNTNVMHLHMCRKRRNKCLFKEEVSGCVTGGCLFEYCRLAAHVISAETCSAKRDSRGRRRRGPDTFSLNSDSSTKRPEVLL